MKYALTNTPMPKRRSCFYCGRRRKPKALVQEPYVPDSELFPATIQGYACGPCAAEKILPGATYKPKRST